MFTLILMFLILGILAVIGVWFIVIIAKTSLIAALLAVMFVLVFTILAFT